METATLLAAILAAILALDDTVDAHTQTDDALHQVDTACTIHVAITTADAGTKDNICVDSITASTAKDSTLPK